MQLTHILAIDDDENVLKTYQTLFSSGSVSVDIDSALDDLSESLDVDLDLTTSSSETPLGANFRLSCASSGESGYQKVQEAIDCGHPFAVIYLDMRMPPGWNGLVTAEKIREIDPDVRIVLITAYSDCSMTEIRNQIGVDFHFLDKPVDRNELTQLTMLLADQWNKFNELQYYRQQLEIEIQSLRMQMIEKDAAKEELYQLARTDTLTGAYNRLVLDERYRQAGERAKMSSKMIGLFIFDLDKFKEINDDEGHHVGDAFLIETTKRLSSEIRQTDIVVRLGGDEFCVLAEGLTTDGVMILTHRLRMALEAPFAFEGKIYIIYASLGVAISEDGDEELVELLKTADVLMYEEKRKKNISFRAS